MCMNNGNRTRALIRITTQKVTRDRSKGGYFVCNNTHCKITDHAAHGKSSEVNSVTINLITFFHIINNSEEKLNIFIRCTLGIDIPCRKSRLHGLWVYHSKTGSIRHLVPASIVVLVSWILIHSMYGNNQRRSWLKARRHIGEHLSLITSHLKCF